MTVLQAEGIPLLEPRVPAARPGSALRLHYAGTPWLCARMSGGML